MYTPMDSSLKRLTTLFFNQSEKFLWDPLRSIPNLQPKEATRVLSVTKDEFFLF